MTTSLNQRGHHSPHTILSNRKESLNYHTSHPATDNERKSAQTHAHTLDYPDTFEYKNKELSNFLNQKRQELDTLNTNLKFQNPGLYELVKQHEKEFTHSPLNSPFKNDNNKANYPEWLDRDAEREKRFKLREQEKIHQGHGPTGKSEHLSNVKSQHEEVTPKHSHHIGSGKSPVNRTGDVKGRNSAYNGANERKRTPVKVGLENGRKYLHESGNEMKGLMVKGTSKDLNKRSVFDKENLNANVPVKHSPARRKEVREDQKINISDIYEHHPVKREKESPLKKHGNQEKHTAHKKEVRENQINISDIYEHHPIKKETPLKQKTDETQGKQTSPNYPQKESANHGQDRHQKERQADDYDDLNVTAFEAFEHSPQHPDHSPQRYDEKSKGDQHRMKDNYIRESFGQVQKSGKKEGETNVKQHDDKENRNQLENKGSREHDTDKDLLFYEKLQEDDLRRSQLRSQQMRKYSEDLRKQIEEHEEQKRREKLKKQEEEAREAQKEQERVQQALKRVEKEENDHDDSKHSGSYAKEKGHNERQSSKDQEGKGSSDEAFSPYKQYGVGSNNHSQVSQAQKKNVFDFSPAAFYHTSDNTHESQHNYEHMPNKNEMSYDHRHAGGDRSQEMHGKLSQSMVGQRQLAEKLMEEKLKAENLALQEQLLFEQYKSKIKDLEVEKLLRKQHHMMPVNNLNFPDLSVSPITRKSSQLSGIGQSPFGQDIGINNFGAHAHMVMSMQPQLAQSSGKQNYMKFSFNPHEQQDQSHKQNGHDNLAGQGQMSMSMQPPHSDKNNYMKFSFNPHKQHEQQNQPHTHTHNHNHKQDENKAHNNDDEEDAVSVEADSLEQSFQNKSLPSSHYECQITKDQLNQSYKKDFVLFKQLCASALAEGHKEGHKEDAGHHKKSERASHDKQGHLKNDSYEKSGHKESESKGSGIYSVNNMGLMMTPETSETRKDTKKESKHHVTYGEKLKPRSSEDSDDQGSYQEDSDMERIEQFKSSEGFKQETAKFPVHKFDRAEEIRQSNKKETHGKEKEGSKEESRNLTGSKEKVSAVDHNKESKSYMHKGDRAEETEEKKNKHNDKGHQLNKNQTPVKQKDDSRKELKDTTGGKQKGSTGTADHEKESKSQLRNYLDLTTPQSTSSQRTSLSNKKYKSPKAIDPFSKRAGQESAKVFTKDGAFTEEKVKEDLTAAEWKKRVHDLLQSKGKERSNSTQKENLSGAKPLPNSIKQGITSVTSGDDLKQAEEMVHEMEEEERCIEEYEKQINESSKKAAGNEFDHGLLRQGLHVNQNKANYPAPSSVRDEDQEEIEASEQTQRSLFNKRFKEIDFTNTNNNSKAGTQRLTGKSWLESDRQGIEEVVELETGNWEDLKWGLIKEGIIEDANEGNKRQSHEKRSQEILHKLEELLDGWTQEGSEKESSVRGGRGGK